MGYTFRTPGPWGPGISEDLTPAQVDANFWQAIQDIQAKAVQGVGITNVVVDGNQFTFVLSDHTLLGPYPLPMMTIQFRGEWMPGTSYSAGDVITANGSAYMVTANHVSAQTFDPYANDGFGNDYYGLLLSNPANVMPTGGPAGWFLRKATSADYVTHWATAAIEDLSDVAIAVPANGQVLTYEAGHWQNLALPSQALESLSDVEIFGALQDTQVLMYMASTGTWSNEFVTMALHQLTDTNIYNPSAGQPLVWNGSAWADTSTVDMPCGGLVNAAGAITIDRAGGEIHRLLLIGTVTDVTILGWPPGGQFARLVLEIQDQGGYGFAFPDSVMWPSGMVPAITPNGNDVFILITFDGGSTIYGNVVGQAFATASSVI